MQAVTERIQSSQSKNLFYFEFSRVSPGAYPLTKMPEDSGYGIGLAVKFDAFMRLKTREEKLIRIFFFDFHTISFFL